MKSIISLSLLFFFITPLSAQDSENKVNNKWDKVVEAIWSLEEDYISYFVEANHKAILSFYHSKFLGWPDSELHPADKKKSSEIFRRKLSRTHPGSLPNQSKGY